MAINISSCKVGSMETNCYVITESETNKSLIVDPGELTEQLEKLLSEMEVTEFEYILLTHGHYDHILAVEAVQKKYAGKIVIHENDSDCFENPMKSLTAFSENGKTLDLRADITVRDGDVLAFGNQKINVIYTPGHTDGSVCYLILDRIFTGDTLFKGSVGRTDFPSGSMKDMMNSVAKLKALDYDYYIYPGHGDTTNLNYEKEHNIYMR